MRRIVELVLGAVTFVVFAGCVMFLKSENRGR